MPELRATTQHNEMHTVHELIIVGAGPAGLAAAIAARQGGLDYVMLEKGVLVNSIFHFPHGMTFFTTPELLEIGGLPFVTPYEKPTRAEALRYYRRVVETYKLEVELGREVASIQPSNDGTGGFVLDVRSRDGAVTRRARAVIVSTGYYDHPNRLGIPGEDLPHVSHYYREAHAHYRQSVVVVGGKNSAAIAALDLYRAGARVTLVHRGERLRDSIKYWIRPDIDNRIREGSVQARFQSRVTRIGEKTVVVEGPTGSDELPADAVLLLTGYHPDAELLRHAGIEVDEVTFKPVHDPETLETNVAGLFLAGAIVSGNQTNKIFIENGRFHGEAAIAAIRRRLGKA